MITIELNEMEFYAFHGVHEAENKLGGKYQVDIHYRYDASMAQQSDDVNDTVDYETIYQHVEEIMQVRSKLLEHLAQQVIDKLLSADDRIQWIWVRIAKINPPIQGSIKNVAVVLEQNRKK